MRKGIGLIVIALSFLALTAGLASAKDTVFGKGVSSHETIAVSKLMAEPDKYVGQTLRVAGLAVGVCKHCGCWVNIASDVEGETLRLKVEDGVIVFPPEILGETIIAEGVWTSNKLDLETTKKVCAYEAEKAGKDFNPDEVTQCMTEYELSGTGAVVLEKTDEPSKS